MNWYIFPQFWKFNVLRWHHLYTGLIIIVIGWFCAGWIAWLFFAVGCWLLIDDITQHIIQKKDSNYHSLGHRLGRPLYHLRRWIIKKTGWKWLNRF